MYRQRHLCRLLTHNNLKTGSIFLSVRKGNARQDLTRSRSSQLRHRHLSRQQNATILMFPLKPNRAAAVYTRLCLIRCTEVRTALQAQSAVRHCPIPRSEARGLDALCRIAPPLVWQESPKKSTCSSEYRVCTLLPTGVLQRCTVTYTCCSDRSRKFEAKKTARLLATLHVEAT